MSELDDFAQSMETEIDRYLGKQVGSDNYVEIGFAVDKSVGDYPQAKLDASKEYLEDDGDLYHDRFPASLHEPILLKLRSRAKWTDVLSSGLWSEGFLLNTKAMSIFENFDLGNSKMYDAEVKDKKGNTEKYTYLFVANHVYLEDMDIDQCEFYLADMLGSPRRLVEVTSIEDFQQKREQALNGELEGSKRFYGLRYKKLTFRAGQTPAPAIFGVARLGTTMYILNELYSALKDAKVTGLEFKRNKRLFE